ncbi:hypothetical protein OG21DRAFT_1488716 [Imleria badia]|nr:hypothetical protein OG21DRAFT_1488716 [Imleria badia]
MAGYEPRKRSTPCEDAFPGLVDARKKSRTVNEDFSAQGNVGAGTLCRSSRANKGNGGQIAQLENIDRILTEQTWPSKSSHAAQLELATAGEPLNPMALTKLRPRPKPRVKSNSAPVPARDNQLGLEQPSQRFQVPAGLDRAPPPAYQLAIQGSRYGFRPPVSEKQHERDETIPARGVDYRDATPLPQASVAILSHGGSVAPACRGRSAAPASHGGSVIPVSCGGSIAPSSCGGSVTPSSHGSSIAPPSRAGSIAPRLVQVQSLPRPVEAQSLLCPMEAQSLLRPMEVLLFLHLMEAPCVRLTTQLHRLEKGLFLHLVEALLSLHLIAELLLQCLAACPLELGIPLNELPPLSASGYNSDEEQSQLPEHHYYGAHSLPVALAIGLSTRCLPMKKLDKQRTFFETIGLTLIINHKIPTVHLLIMHPPFQPLSGNSVAPLPQETPLNKDLSTPRPDTEGPVADATNGSSVPPAELSGTATKLHSYPYKFREVIERAKQFAQCGAAIDPFPSRAWFIDEKSSAYITEAIAERNEQGVFIPPGYWPHYRKDLGILLWEALMSWRSTLKAKAREHVTRYYPLGGSQTPAENLANAEALIQGVLFVRDSVMEDGTTRNMASPALASLIVEFFYTGPSALVNLFPEVFSQEVPKPVVCLAATALRAAIDEYMITGTQQDRQFEYITYSKIFVQFMGMQAKIDGNAKHTAMAQELRRSWATVGSALFDDSNMMVAGEDDFEVVLN